MAKTLISASFGGGYDLVENYSEEIPITTPPPGSVVVTDDFRNRPVRAQKNVPTAMKTPLLLLIPGKHQHRTTVRAR